MQNKLSLKIKNLTIPINFKNYLCQMHLVADSGSTKTDWRIIDNTNFIVQSAGFNPMVQDEETMLDNLFIGELMVISKSIKQISFFGAGCSNPEANKKMTLVLAKVFSEAIINVDHDIKGAALALLGNRNGLACILGTGSNSALFIEGEITQKVPSLGHIIGDDGGGFSIGRSFLRHYIYEGKDWSKLIEKAGLESNPKQIIKEMYAQKKPNTFVASYAQIPIANKNVEEFNKIISVEIEQFFSIFVDPYLENINQIGFIGSVAYFNKDIIELLCEKRKITLLKIIKQPIDDLVEFLSHKTAV